MEFGKLLSACQSNDSFVLVMPTMTIRLCPSSGIAKHLFHWGGNHFTEGGAANFAGACRDDLSRRSCSEDVPVRRSSNKHGSLVPFFYYSQFKIWQRYPASNL